MNIPGGPSSVQQTLEGRKAQNVRGITHIHLTSELRKIFARFDRSRRSQRQKRESLHKNVSTDQDSVSSEEDEGLHAQLWDGEVGEPLSSMMIMAGYADESRDAHRAFFARSVATSLGPYPAHDTTGIPKWESFMTDDHTPLELSWAWSDKQDTPAVRYSVEPISWAAGSVSDPFNSRAAVSLLGRTLPNAPSLDLLWYRYFLANLTLDTSSAKDQTRAGAAGPYNSRAGIPPSQTFIAFDLDGKGNMIVKYYFMPTLKASAMGKSNLELTETAIRGLPPPRPAVSTSTKSTPPTSSPSLLESFNTVKQYIVSHSPVEEQPVVEIVAVDCIDPTESRIKIYIRSRRTSFNSMIDVMTLGGRLPAFSEKTACSLKELWLSIFGGRDDHEFQDAPLHPEKDHRTGGLLYYLELKPGSRLPSSKVYLPVRHYARNDDQIARGLSDFLQRRGKCLAGGMTYYEGVKSLCKHRKLEDGLGFHSYITCAVKNDALAINTYLNPELYHKSRF